MKRVFSFALALFLILILLATLIVGLFGGPAPRSYLYGHHRPGCDLRLFADHTPHKTLTKTTHTLLFRLRGQKGRQITLSSFLSSVSGPGSARIDGIAIRRPLVAIHDAELFPYAPQLKQYHLSLISCQSAKIEPFSGSK